MAFKEIQMWADIIDDQIISERKYVNACNTSIRNSELLESQEFSKEKQRVLDPTSYGFKKRIDGTLYEQVGVSGKIAISTQDYDGNFIKSMAKQYPSIVVEHLVPGTNSGVVVHGKYDDLLDIWCLNESGKPYAQSKSQSMKSKFDKAFFCEAVEREPNPLDEEVDLAECGFNQVDEVDYSDDDYGTIELAYDLTDNTAEEFIDMLKNEYGIDTVYASPKNTQLNGNQEIYKFTGSKRDLREMYAIYQGFQNWDKMRVESPEDEEEFNELFTPMNNPPDEVDFGVVDYAIPDDEYEDDVFEGEGFGKVETGLDFFRSGDDFNQNVDQPTSPELYEADEREPISHGLDFFGVKASTANLSDRDEVSLDIAKDDDLSPSTCDSKQKMFDSMLMEATIEDQLDPSVLSQLDSIQTKLEGDSTPSSEEVVDTNAEDDVDGEDSTYQTSQKYDPAEDDYFKRPYANLTKDGLESKLNQLHGITPTEMKAFWEVWGLLGYEPADMCDMSDGQVVEIMTMHIPKGQKPGFQPFLDPKLKVRAYLDNAGGDGKGGFGLKQNHEIYGVTDVRATDLWPTEDHDDRRQRKSILSRTAHEMSDKLDSKLADIPQRGKSSWTTDEVGKFIKSIPVPKARKILKSIIDDIKMENGIPLDAKNIDGKLSGVSNEAKEKAAQEILFLKSLFGKYVGINPTLKDYPYAWGKDSRGKYVSNVTAGLINDETEAIFIKAMRDAGADMTDPSREHQLRSIAAKGTDAIELFIKGLVDGFKGRSYGSISKVKPEKTNVPEIPENPVA